MVQYIVVGRRYPPGVSSHAPGQYVRKVAVPLNDEPAFTPKRKLRVIIFGAGYSGLIFAHKLQNVRKEADAILEHIIFKAKQGVSFDPNPEWSHFYPSGQGILEYLQKAVRKWGRDRDILTTRRSYRQKREEYAGVLVSARGFLSTCHRPEIPGRSGWDHGFDYSYKRIGVISNGSSGIQILPQMANLEGTTVTSFQRGPTWVSSRLSPAALLGSEDQSPNPEYCEEDKLRLRDPDELREYRKKVQGGINKASKLFIKGSDANKAATGFAVTQMSENINAIIEGGIQTEDGTYHDLDIIICNAPYPVIGRDGIKLAEKWKDEPESYLSLACPSTPHYFILTGPNSTVGHGNLIQSIGWGAEWMMQWLTKMSAENIASVAPKQDVANEFVRYGDQFHRTLTWTVGCRSWYKNGRMGQRIRPEDFDIRYSSGNRFRFMGNGFTHYGLQERAGLAYCLTT
ncbi:hypothetical protein B0J12DRAFT_721499 [Macrophomina phaseolina]|uniref:FAD/NAD(P)-binding domain-containing protein n=1 Tax=Macrophomina phaseolina TaxID=35725 RepID=A0ABQ8FY16_9PEZI|nr:hypothetical protein B0J12DRAFT_721499 [Macrophomina phaseolina]